MAKTPTVEELLAVFAKGHAREEAIREQISSLAKEMSALKLELAESKKLRPPPSNCRGLLAEASQQEVTNRLIEEEPLAATHSTVSAVAITGPRSSEFSELIGLMKLSHARDLPSFYGSLKDWPYFLAVYNRTTAAASIDDETNVGRLDKALSGEARELVLDLLTLGRRPSEIIDMLQRRYGNKDLLLRRLSSNLIEFPTILSTKDPSLRRFAVAIKTYVAQLRTMKLHEELNSSLLVAHLHEKLSNLPTMFQKWTRRNRDTSEPIVEVFANFLLDQWEHLPHDFSCAQESKSTARNDRPLSVSRFPPEKQRFRNSEFPLRNNEGSPTTWEPGEIV
jgi:hypothetical protein